MGETGNVQLKPKDKVPHCYNRPKFNLGYWAPNGFHHLGKVRFRWVEFRMANICLAWAAPRVDLSGPGMDKWNCKGCKWYGN